MYSFVKKLSSISVNVFVKSAMNRLSLAYDRVQ